MERQIATEQIGKKGRVYFFESDEGFSYRFIPSNGCPGASGRITSGRESLEKYKRRVVSDLLDYTRN